MARRETRGGIFYTLPDLFEGDVLTFYMEATSGNLDPVMGVVDDDGLDTVAAVGGFWTAVQDGIDAGRDPLVVIPELRISDLGIVDVTKFEVVPLIVS